MYEDMYECAYINGADAFYCDFRMVFKSFVEVYKATPHSDCKVEFLSNYINCAWTCLWNLLIKRDIYPKNSLRLPHDMRYCEDFGLSVRLFYYAEKFHM